jgi:hypothetical protein
MSRSAPLARFRQPQLRPPRALRPWPASTVFRYVTSCGADHAAGATFNYRGEQHATFRLPHGFRDKSTTIRLPPTWLSVPPCSLRARSGARQPRHARAEGRAARDSGWLRSSLALRCAPGLRQCQAGTGKQAFQPNRKAADGSPCLNLIAARTGSARLGRWNREGDDHGERAKPYNEIRAHPRRVGAAQRSARHREELTETVLS